MRTRAIAWVSALAIALGGTAFAKNNKKAAQDKDDQGKHAAVKIINGPRVEGTGDTWAVIAWTTNEASSSIIRYGTNGNRLDRTAESPYADTEGANKQTHRVKITGLNPGTTYYFAVDSGQGEGTGTEAKSSIGQFTTKGSSAGSVSSGAGSMSGMAAGDRDEQMKHAAVKITDGPRVEGTGSSWAVIAWTTNEASSSIIRYGTDRNSLNQTAESSYADKEGANKQTHRVHINNLKPHTTYYFVVDSGQGEGTGTEAKSNEGSFSTK